VQLRLTPEITFAYDDSIERGARLLRLISEVQSEEAAAQRDEETDN
jgi:ribosome-binding factor A